MIDDVMTVSFTLEEIADVLNEHLNSKFTVQEIEDAVERRNNYENERNNYYRNYFSETLENEVGQIALEVAKKISRGEITEVWGAATENDYLLDGFFSFFLNECAAPVDELLCIALNVDDERNIPQEKLERTFELIRSNTEKTIIFDHNSKFVKTLAEELADYLPEDLERAKKTALHAFDPDGLGWPVPQIAKMLHLRYNLPAEHVLHALWDWDGLDLDAASVAEALRAIVKDDDQLATLLHREMRLDFDEIAEILKSTGTDPTQVQLLVGTLKLDETVGTDANRSYKM